MIRRLLLATVVAFVLTPSVAAAVCTVSWDDGAADRLWSSAANWAGDTVPGTSAEVCIGSLAGDPVVMDTDVTVSTVETEHPVEIRETFTGTLADGAYTLADSSSLVGATIGAASVTVPPGLTASMVGGVIGEGSAVEGDGDLVIATPGPTTWTGGTMGGAGMTQVAPGASLVIDGGLPAIGSAGFAFSVALLDQRHLSNRGSMTWQSGLVVLADSSTFENRGTLSLVAPSSQWVGGTVVNTGLIAKTGTNTVDFNAVDNDGTISVTRGELRFGASLLSTVDSRVELELGGTAGGTQHGLVSAHSFVGVVRLSGTLAVTLSSGYTPVDGDAFDIVEGMLVKGQFAAYEGLARDGGMSLVPSYTATKGTLTATSAHGRSLAPDAPAEGLFASAALPPPRIAPPLIARNDVVRRRARRVLRFGGLLANDSSPAGTRVELIGRPRRTSVRLDSRTGALRIRVRPRAPRVLVLRYRLVGPDGHRSLAATVRIRLGRR